MLAIADFGMHIIPQAARLFKALRVYTNGDSEAAEALRKAIEATTLPATVESRKIARSALKSPGSSAFTVALEGGQQNTEGFFGAFQTRGFSAGSEARLDQIAAHPAFEIRFRDGAAAVDLIFFLLISSDVILPAPPNVEIGGCTVSL
ncbi:uncharacterized protein E0L32_002896 [Thyridium curvatum]|uniref:Uncharacterized protein n=1 Tax=Thyridium curvatum TaxID=1093900 RepID=A0A507B3V5_9PEZI|nr:uncharacterized protein E0L32_002896 [Thyridium curvatum]TPX17795.1 hypothetical protein E0L32_002896 [Thyridium curvatum]